MPRIRLDQLVTQKGFAESREKAQRLIRSGAVRVGGHPQTKPGHLFPDDAVVEVTEKEKYVSRGGIKLETALKNFPINLQGVIAVDVGASTGGFTDCMLQNGASKVYAIDVGSGQLNWNLRNDPRVIVHDGLNARYLKASLFDEQPSFAVVDVSFISLKLILPPLVAALSSPAELVTLIKPQFEAGREEVGKNGVVRDPAVRQAVVDRIKHFGEEELNLICSGVCESEIKGPAGNVEFLAWWKKSS